MVAGCENGKAIETSKLFGNVGFHLKRLSFLGWSREKGRARGRPWPSRLPRGSALPVSLCQADYRNVRSAVCFLCGTLG
jgi:hypothetical protein